jgi:DNA-binding Xre family transcriptional regulator
MTGFASVVNRNRSRMPSNAIQARKQLVLGMGDVRLKLHTYAISRGIVVKAGAHKGKANQTQLYKMTGVSHDALFYMLRYPETVKSIHFRTLARLCHGLNCQPGDLIEYTRLEDLDAPLSEQYKRAPWPEDLSVGNDLDDLDNLSSPVANE